jgi:NTP pyrophosphatase (non-canonical NTP hydrolase)
MYGQIFPASQTEKYEMVFGRFTEELGELAEAIRIGGVMPGYFVSEAADVFAWLMKLTNVYEAKQRFPVAERGDRLEATMYEQYPDKCRECGNAVCNCPPLLPKTLGRIAHDGPDASLLEQSGPFMSQAEAASFFEVGSRQIGIGAHKFPVTPAVIQEAAFIAQVVGKIAPDAVPDHALRQLRAISDSMTRKVAANAVRDRDIGNLIRVLKLLSDSERSPILTEIAAGQKNGLIRAIVSQFMENAS